MNRLKNSAGCLKRVRLWSAVFPLGSFVTFVVNGFSEVSEICAGRAVACSLPDGNLRAFLHAFQFQEFFFHTQPAPVAGKRAVGADYAVAGHDNGDGVVMVGLAHGAKGLRASDFAGDIRIRAGLAGGDAGESEPAFLLNSCAN